MNKIVFSTLLLSAMLMNCTQRQSAQEAQLEVEYMALGKDIAQQTQMILAGNLKAAIAKKGAPGALDFCNAKAIALTDSMASALDARVYRVTDRTRNPNNQANADQLAYIRESKDALASGKEIGPRLQELDGKMVGYYPIVTNALCLQCHGDQSQISDASADRLKSLYPNDKATGYSTDQLRGIWVVEMGM